MQLPYFTFTHMGKLALNYARSSGTPPSHKMQLYCNTNCSKYIHILMECSLWEWSVVIKTCKRYKECYNRVCGLWWWSEGTYLTKQTVKSEIKRYTFTEQCVIEKSFTCIILKFSLWKVQVPERAVKYGTIYSWSQIILRHSSNWESLTFRHTRACDWSSSWQNWRIICLHAVRSV